MGEFSLSHILLVGLILLIFFGPSRLPALGQSLGKAIRGFKDGMNQIDAEYYEKKDEARRPADQQSQQRVTGNQHQQDVNQTNNQTNKSETKNS